MKTIQINDKYTILYDENPDTYRFECLRYGEPWWDLIGNGLALAMLQKIEHLEELLEICGNNNS